jgi:hypothetical protein
VDKAKPFCISKREVWEAYKRVRRIAFEHERYADDVICHCDSQAQATALWEALTLRMRDCKLELHPEKTQIAYCRDGKRRGGYPQRKFDFLGYTFKPRRAMTRGGKLFVNFAPGVSDAAGTHSVRGIGSTGSEPSDRTCSHTGSASQRLDNRSRMNREVHVRFWESAGVRFPCATQPYCSLE